MSSHIAQYQDNESQKYASYTDLKTKYDLLVSKERDLVAVKQPKIFKKEELLKGKLEMTLSKEEDLELQIIEDEERITLIMNRGIEDARKKFDSIKEFYESQAEAMRGKSKRIFDIKKKSLEYKETAIQNDRQHLEGGKTSAEYTNDRNKQEILKKMNNVIYQIRMGREQFRMAGEEPNDFAIPVLPEPLNKKILPSVEDIEPIISIIPPVIRAMPPSVMCEFKKEEANLKELRKQAIREDRQERRAEEEQKERDREIYMENLKIKQEAEVKRQDERRKKELQDTPVTISHEDEDFKESFKEFMMTDEEVMARSKVLREQYKPPLTPFNGLPAPDAPRVKKPVKTVRSAGILYATPVEIT